jgi:hypothetical protein
MAVKGSAKAAAINRRMASTCVSLLLLHGPSDAASLNAVGSATTPIATLSNPARK